MFEIGDRVRIIDDGHDDAGAAGVIESKKGTATDTDRRTVWCVRLDDGRLVVAGDWRLVKSGPKRNATASATDRLGPAAQRLKHLGESIARTVDVIDSRRFDTLTREDCFREIMEDASKVRDLADSMTRSAADGICNGR